MNHLNWMLFGINCSFADIPCIETNYKPIFTPSLRIYILSSCIQKALSYCLCVQNLIKYPFLQRYKDYLWSWKRTHIYTYTYPLYDLNVNWIVIIKCFRKRDKDAAQGCSNKSKEWYYSSKLWWNSRMNLLWSLIIC